MEDAVTEALLLTGCRAGWRSGHLTGLGEGRLAVFRTRTHQVLWALSAWG